MYKELIKLINKNDVISFDVFDTLLLRNVYKPVDIFRILSKIALEKYNVDDFYTYKKEIGKQVSATLETKTHNNGSTSLAITKIGE